MLKTLLSPSPHGNMANDASPANANASLSNGTNGAKAATVNGTATSASPPFASKHKLAPHFIGGNHLGVAPAGAVKDFVAAHDGHTVITSVRVFSCLRSLNPP